MEKEFEKEQMHVKKKKKALYLPSFIDGNTMHSEAQVRNLADSYHFVSIYTLSFRTTLNLQKT